VATLDALSQGQVILGVAAGYLEGEFAALGAPFADRGARLDRAIDAMKQARRLPRARRALRQGGDRRSVSPGPVVSRQNLQDPPSTMSVWPVT
jgi:alkanesulfonate monooxygenase SsuD/methylene tetrahydromethanopterin reductase-like flavin-dependent oxidoreductase (luciferase family)